MSTSKGESKENSSQLDFFESGFGKLASVLIKQLETISKREKSVNIIIQRFASPKMLTEAKSRATKAELEILNSLLENVVEMADFLKDIIRIENTFNSLYSLHKAAQMEARTKYAPNMTLYEPVTQTKDDSPSRAERDTTHDQSKAQGSRYIKPKNNVGSFIELMIKCEAVYFPHFQSLLNEILAACDEENILIANVSKNDNSNIEEKSDIESPLEVNANEKQKKKKNEVSSMKKMDRAFFKTFYIYKSDHNRLCDVLRGSLVFTTFDDLYKTFSIIEKIIGQDNILRVKDRFVPEHVPFGYRDICINIYCPCSDKHIVCELQLHHIMFYSYKKISHKLYKKARLFENAITDTNAAYQYAIKYVKPIVKNETIEQSRMPNIIVVSTNVQNVNMKDNLSSFDSLLENWNLSQYKDNFINTGYDDPIDWIHLSNEKLVNIIQMKEGHAKRFLRCYLEYYLKHLAPENDSSNVKTSSKDENTGAGGYVDEMEDEFDMEYLEMFLKTNAQHLSFVFTELDDVSIYQQAQKVLSGFFCFFSFFHFVFWINIL